MLKKNSKLQQIEYALLTAQQVLEETCQHAEGTEATLRSEQDAFEETMECLNDDLSRAQITLDEAKAREQETVADCQRALKVFKFKKYKEEYEDGKHGAFSKYALDVGSILKSEGQDSPKFGATHAAEVETSLNAQPRDASPLTTGLLLIAFDAAWVAGVFSVIIGETALNTSLGDAAP